MAYKNNYKGKCLYFLYNVIWVLILLPLCGLIFWRYKKYVSHSIRFGERLAFFKNNKQFAKKICLHLASVGEVNAAIPLLSELIKQYGSHCLLVTTTTPTGEEVLKKAFGETIEHAYLPFDQCLLVRRFLSKYDLHTIVLFETEVWPSLITEANKHDVSIMLINARMSEKSQRKYLQFESFSRLIFGQISLIAAQTKEDVDRFRKLGAFDCEVSGSLKFSAAVDENLIKSSREIKAQWLAATNNKKIIVAASTHPVEEGLILDAFAQLKKMHANVLLILAPRHVERASDVEILCRRKELSLVRFFENNLPGQSTDIVLVDVVGKLFSLFGLADVAIMGGTFIERGGHNFLEPAAWGVPIISGYSDYNFLKISQDLSSIGVLNKIESDDKLLAQELKQLLSNDLLCKEKGNAAKKYIESNRGAIKELMKIINSFIA